MSKEKRFAPSRRKIKKAREDGDVAKSRDLSSAVALSAGFSWVFLWEKKLVALGLELQRFFSLNTDLMSENVLIYGNESAAVLLGFLGPLLALLFFSVLCAELLQVGVNFSLKPLAFRWSRLHLFHGLRRVIGFEQTADSSGVPMRLLFEFAKLIFYIISFTLLLLGLLGYFAGALFYEEGLQAETLGALAFAGSRYLLCGALGVLILGGAAELLYQKNRQRRRLMMDAEEFKREHRESEGSPELRGLRKQLYQELFINGIVQSVRKAKVLVLGSKSLQNY